MAEGFSSVAIAVNNEGHTSTKIFNTESIGKVILSLITIKTRKGGT